MKNRIIEILMTRDELSRPEAENLFAEVKEMIEDAAAAGNYEEAEEIFESEFGLEPDYLPDLIL